MLVRYNDLWTQAAARRDQGKDRPACLVAASDSQTRPRFVVLLPITHTPPDGDTIGIEIPAKVKQAIGLDDARSWVIVSEHNIDEWPNAGLSPVPGKPGVFGYGFIPPGLFAQIKARFLELARQNKSGAVRRWLRRDVREAFDDPRCPVCPLFLRQSARCVDRRPIAHLPREG